MTAAAHAAENPSPGDSSSARYPIIDVLRGISILLVVVRHLELRVPLERLATTGALPHALWSIWCRNGNEGVRLFFVTSGFLITSTALRRWGSLPSIDVLRFYQLRLARIMPPLLVLLAVLSLLHAAGVEGYVIDERVSYGRALLAALTFHVNWLEASRSLYLPAGWDVLWSLAVEEVFYLLFPLICWLYRWRRLGQALLVLLCLIGPVVRVLLVDAPMWQAKAYLACMDGIALGCLTAAATQGRSFSARTLQMLAGFGGALVFAVLLLAREPAFQTFTTLRLHLSLLSLGCAALLVAGARLRLSPWLCAALRPLRACGRLSYEIYLTHVFVLLAAVSYFRARAWPAGAELALYTLVVIGCWALGALVERHLSSPASRWVRAAGDRAGERGAAVRAPAPRVAPLPPPAPRSRWRV